MLRLALVCLALSAGAAHAQSSDPAHHGDHDDAEAAVRTTITRLFDGMRAADTTAVRATLHPTARLMTAAVRDGQPMVVGAPIDGFLAAIAGAGVELDEQIPDTYPVLIDQGLAVAWTPYRFYAGGQFSHCGTNAFTLAQTGDGWQIVQVMDTRRADCD